MSLLALTFGAGSFIAAIVINTAILGGLLHYVWFYLPIALGGTAIVLGLRSLSYGVTGPHQRYARIAIVFGILTFLIAIPYAGLISVATFGIER
jgi:hypothetical protein